MQEDGCIFRGETGLPLLAIRILLSVIRLQHSGMKMDPDGKISFIIALNWGYKMRVFSKELDQWWWRNRLAIEFLRGYYCIWIIPYLDAYSSKKR